MPTNSDRALVYLASHPEGRDDDQIAEALGIDRHEINAICRHLAAAGAIRRERLTSKGKVLNWPISEAEGAQPPAPVTVMQRPAATLVPHVTLAGPIAWLGDSDATQQFAYAGEAHLTEDQVKAAIKQAFEAQGWQTEVRWGQVRGIDIEAISGEERFVLEAKGEGLSDQMRGNYFDGALGELVRRMNDSNARYGLALPAHRRFTNLVARVPFWIRQRLNLWFFFVRPQGSDLEVGIFPPDGKRDAVQKP